MTTSTSTNTNTFAVDNEFQDIGLYQGRFVGVATTVNKSTTAVAAIRVTVPFRAPKVKATFNPLSADRDQRTAQLNQAVRLGYRPAKSSTK